MARRAVWVIAQVLAAGALLPPPKEPLEPQGIAMHDEQKP